MKKTISILFVLISVVGLSTANAQYVLKEADLHSKGVNYQATSKSNDDILRQLVWQILH